MTVGPLVIADAPGWLVALTVGALYGANGVAWAATFAVLLTLIRRGADEGDPDAAACAAEFDRAVLSDRGMAVAVLLTWPVAMFRSGILR